MRSRTKAVLLAAAALAGCAAPARYAALGPDQLELAAEQCSRPNPPRYESTWQPGPEDLTGAEQELAQLDALAPADCCGAARPGDPKAYQRQYFGIVSGGRRLLYANAFLDSMPNKEWQHYAIVVCDGGSGAWGAVYDPRQRRWSELRFNGGGG
jgi:hypothetical protein